MKYTNNTHNKLLLNGFKLKYSHEENTDGYLNYTVYEKGFIEVTVCDSHKHVDIHLDADEEALSYLSMTNLIELDKLINNKKNYGYRKFK